MRDDPACARWLRLEPLDERSARKVGGSSQRSPQNFDPPLFWRSFKVAKPNLRPWILNLGSPQKGVMVRWNVDAAVIPEVFPKTVMDFHCPIKLRDDVDVVVESKEALIW